MRLYKRMKWQCTLCGSPAEVQRVQAQDYDLQLHVDYIPVRCTNPRCENRNEHVIDGDSFIQVP